MHKPCLYCCSQWHCCCCFSGVPAQVPIAFSRSKHRSTLIDSEFVPGASRNKVLPGTSDTPSALASLPAYKAQLPSCKPSPSAQAAAARASRKIQSSKASAQQAAESEQQDAVSWTIYQSDFAATAAASASSTNILIHSPARVAAARRELESNNEWAEINKLETLRAQQEVRQWAWK